MNKKHKDIKYQDPGMTIFSTHPFISVTPDLEIDCACHGPGLVEIKCPASLIGKVPQKDNYKHLEAREFENKLRKSSEYYFRVATLICKPNSLISCSQPEEGRTRKHKN